MATISHKMHPHWLAIRAVGVLTLKEMLAVVDDNYPLNKTGGTIWNLLEANLDHLGLKDFQGLARHAATRYPRNYRKTAFVGLDQVYSQVCMCSAIAAMENEGIEYCAFLSLAEAENWLTQNLPLRIPLEVPCSLPKKTREEG